MYRPWIFCAEDGGGVGRLSVLALYSDAICLTIDIVMCTECALILCAVNITHAVMHTQNYSAF